jgi:hypothetical protein
MDLPSRNTPPVRPSRFSEEANELDCLANALERECASWRTYEITEGAKFPSHEYTLERREAERRSNVLWENAVAVGRLMCSLSDRGAFDDRRRIKNAVGQIRAELAKARREHKAPIYYFVVNLPYRPLSPKESYDVFFVKLFEGYCKIAARSPEDRRAFQRYYVQPEEKGAFHVKMMRGLARMLRA